ncbi:MAG: tetratricopeptide repeat protein, partial [Deltaproteobacteria bacterium]|nr:tetratricopeptide repeat protein [Deltaproteobacteria bacterium]
YDDALSQYFVAKKVLPYNVNLIRFAGLCYFNQNQLAEAEKYFLNYLTMDPDSPPVLNDLGSIYFRQAKYDEAIVIFQRAIITSKTKKFYAITEYSKPAYAEPHLNLAGAYVFKNRLDDAISECRKALQIDPGLVGARNMLSALYREKGDDDRARAVLDRRNDTAAGG